MHPSAKRLRDQIIEGDEESNAEYSGSTFGGFGEYFRNKQVKLQTQDRTHHAQKSKIFAGCVCYITGYTNPSATTLKRLIVENGGSICAFLGGKSYATHIIAETLTARKNELYQKYTVVKPLWVIDSVEAQKIQDWTKYRTIDPAKGSSMFHKPPEEREVQLEEDIVSEEETAMENDYWRRFVDKEPVTEQEQRDCILKQRERLNCLDPKFLSVFYSSSRLHLLSTTKVALRKRCQEFMAASTRKRSQASPRIIAHVDFDSFFVSVALKKRPDLIDKPVCVSYGGKSSDVASANYPARAFGVKNGMWVGRAKSLCPDLICLPYEFSAYKAISDKFYDIIFALEPDYITPLSIDEAMLDITSLVTESSVPDFVQTIRSKVRDVLGLEVSIGVGPNILGARMGLRIAKPAGQIYFKQPKDIASAIGKLQVDTLPGIGRTTSFKLASLEVYNIEDLIRFSKTDLETRLGKSTGAKLYNCARGIDTDDISSSEQPPKSLGVEVNWGIRFTHAEEVFEFSENLVQDLWERKFGSHPQSITVKLMQKSPDAPFVPPKYMGCGMCDAQSKQRGVDPDITLKAMQMLVKQMLNEFNFAPLIVRGLGLSLKFVDEPDTPKKKLTLLDSFSPSKSKTPSSTSPRKMVTLQPRSRKGGGGTLTQMMAGGQSIPTTEVDMAVFDTLPTQIKREIMENMNDFNVLVPTKEVVPEDLSALSYSSVKLSGMSSLPDLRARIRDWVSSSPKPFYEDVEEFCKFIEIVVHEDWNWMKAMELLAWLNRQIMEHEPVDPLWHQVARMVTEIIDKSRANI